VLAARGTTYELCPPNAPDHDEVAERMIETITKKARSMMIDSQAPLVFWGEAVNTAVCLHQQTTNEGLAKRDDRKGYQAPYPTPYEMLHAIGKPSHNNGNKISYQAPIHHLRRFGCYASRLLPALQRQGKFSTKSKSCMIVGYIHDSTTLWRIWDLAFQVVRSQSNVSFDKERNTHTSCLHGDHTDIIELTEEVEYIKEIDSGDGLLQAPASDAGTQDNETGGDGLLHDQTGNSPTGECHGSGDHDCTDDDPDHNLPNADNRRSLPACTGVKSCPSDQEDAALVFRETFVHNLHLRRKINKAR
jgi:hypothetical protein